MNKNFWKDKKVLITGYEGFLGSNLTHRLISYGAMVVGLDIKVGRKETLLTEYDYDRIIIRQGDVADYQLVRDIIKQHKIEIVFHLAAEAIVSESLKNPLTTFSSNIKGTWSLLEACRNCDSIKAIVTASSDKAYGSHKDLPYYENTPLIGNHPYDVSKSCADLLAHTYFHAYDLPVAITRCGNIFGPGDFNFTRIVPDLMRSVISGETIFIRSDGKFTRDYVYVDDVVEGYILLAEQLRKQRLTGEAFNLSNENPISVLDLVRSVYKFAKKKPNYKVQNIAQYEIKHQYLNSAKAKRLLGWQPRLNLKAALIETLQWYEGLFGKNKGAATKSGKKR